MKTAKSLTELAKEVERQNEVKKDYVAPTNLTYLLPDGRLALCNQPRKLSDAQFFDVNKNCHSQIASRLKIPKQYYDRMLVESPELLSRNVNHWFTNGLENKGPESRMIRTLDGMARAFLSDRYRPLDNYDLLKTALPIISQKQCEVKSCEVTETRMYLKVLFPMLRAEVKKGDVVQAGLCLSNSEIGAGSLKSEILLYSLICDNGMIGSNSMKRYHVGKSQGTDFDSISEVLSTRTKELSDAAFWAQVRDVIKASFNEAHFLNEMDKLREATGEKMQHTNIPKVIEIVKSSFNLNDQQGNDIMQHLCEGGDFTKYGLAQAVTRTASDQESYDDATTLERLGGQIIELAPKDWNQIAKAA